MIFPRATSIPARCGSNSTRTTSTPIAAPPTYLNFSNADVVCLQHEYGIYGGPAGSFILALLRDLRIPVVTTLHTSCASPERDSGA